MPRKKYSTVVNYTSPDGLPSNPPPVDEDGEIDIPEPDEDDVDYDYDQFEHE